MKRNTLWGLILIAIGILFMLNNVFEIKLFDLKYLWPLFILIPGLVFELSFFVWRGNPGLLVPGGILTTIGLLFFFEVFTGWRFSGYTWPIYPLSVAIGLWQFYYFGEQKKELLIPVAILGGVSLISFAFVIFAKLVSWISLSWLIPLVFIVSGIVLLLKRD